jgi:hypothetical protein
MREVPIIVKSDRDATYPPILKFDALLPLSGITVFPDRGDVS